MQKLPEQKPYSAINPRPKPIIEKSELKTKDWEVDEFKVVASQPTQPCKSIPNTPNT